ncbi:MAG: hypothetical protein IV100_00715 [Myxococcales bacterium]|nr:hypothetical protein [Myxococcales bacterium]
MKFKTFRGFVLVGGGAVVVAGLVFAFRSCKDDPEPVAVAQAPLPASPAARSSMPPALPPPVAPVAGPGTLTAFERQVVERARVALSSDKVKDAFSGAAIKVNLYQDAGQALPNRAKLDLDRDDKWDEKWTFERGSGAVTREIAPTDDENYTVSLTLVGERWVAPGAPAPAAATPVAAPALPDGGVPLRRFDGDALTLAEQALTTDKVKDALPGPVKINLYQDAGYSQVNRLKVDLDRDDKWDEKWDFDRSTAPPRVSRQVAPADDEVYAETWGLAPGGWVKVTR